LEVWKLGRIWLEVILHLQKLDFKPILHHPDFLLLQKLD
jgi:hypothetical protein